MGDLKALAKSFLEDVTNDAIDVDSVIDKYLAEDFVEHEPIPGLDNTREAPRQMFKMLRGGFPDLRLIVQDLIQEDDKVVARMTMAGTHKGEFMGVPASGNAVEVNFIDILRFRDEMAVEHWGVMDTGALMQQLGAMG